ncbi:DUF3291 domain-containing protein [Thermomonospora cellulosilytica]|uniref:DUF3291 domain-containing protein n=1 Tax=Thermomonospora cellulosilytica TaxID=1411118 RepID=A0A7W3N210_9ACTN|nr:DUF3291 domain-containing protein [Thermomonospora cellulosilytica]MBA9006034.1 hypothetical protein [Thermomonospora cellulosilytica]
MTDFHLAQFNIARLKAPLDDPSMTGFLELRDPLNALADGDPGFVWRPVSPVDGADEWPYGPDILINYSVWRSREALWEYAYRSGHLEAMRRRREWFDRVAETYQVLWWIPAGHRPGPDECVDRLELLRREGPTPRAFTFRDHYTAEEAARAEAEQAARVG